MIYLLDTNVCIAAMRGNPKVIRELAVRSPEDCAVSMVSVFESFVGVFRCNAPEREGQKVSTFLEPFHLLPFDWDAARTRLSCRKKPLELRVFVTYKFTYADYHDHQHHRGGTPSG